MFVRIADIMYFIGLENCISCAFLFPMVSYARRNFLIPEVKKIFYNTKTQYQERVKTILAHFQLKVDNIHSPTILMVNKGYIGIVDPGVVQECANEIQSFFVGNSEALVEYFEEELEEEELFQRQLYRFSMNLIPYEGDLDLEDFNDFLEY